jgi:uncharacterized membrane protein
MTIILVIAMSLFVAIGNFILALVLLAVAVIILTILKKNVNAVLTDERINAIGGKASRMTMVIFALLMTIAGIVLVSLKNISTTCLIIGNVLLLTECAMMLTYSILFKYYSNRKK